MLLIVTPLISRKAKSQSWLPSECSLSLKIKKMKLRGRKLPGLTMASLHSTLSWNSFPHWPHFPASWSHLLTQAPIAGHPKRFIFLTPSTPHSRPSRLFSSSYLFLQPQGLCTGCKCSLCPEQALSSPFPFVMLTGIHSYNPSSKGSFRVNLLKLLE